MKKELDDLVDYIDLEKQKNIFLESLRDFILIYFFAITKILPLSLNKI